MHSPGTTNPEKSTTAAVSAVTCRLAAAIALLMLSVPSLQAQEWRLSAGYSIQHFDLEIQPNNAFEGAVGTTQKGMLELELERYLLYRFYVGATGQYLLHNQQSVFLGGPVDFRQANLGVVSGMQWSRLGIYAGVQAGRIWDIRFQGVDMDGNPVPITTGTPETSSAWTTALRGGMKYYLLRYVRLQVDVARNFDLPGQLTHQAGAGMIPQVSGVGFQPWTVRAGISVSIPWHNRRRLERLHERNRLPLAMEAAGTSFSSPLREDTFITSPFGQRWGRNHEGVDLQASRGDQVVAADNGIVVQARNLSGYGRTVEIRHSNGYTTRYAHLHRIRTREGQTVRRGEVIGTAGSSGSATGVHLHFEIRRNGAPIDPRRYVRF